MKILFVIDTLRLGGRERRFVEIIKYLVKKNSFLLRVIVLDKNIFFKEVYNLNVPIDVIERRYCKKDIAAFFKIMDIARKFKPDIVHTWGSMATFYASPIKLLLKSKLYANLVSDTEGIKRKMTFRNVIFKFCCLMADKIISNSRAGLYSYGLSKKKSEIIYNGVCLDRFNIKEEKKEIRKLYGIKTKYLVVMVANMSEKKDYDLFVDLAKEVEKERNDIFFLGVGQGKDRDRILKRIEKERLSNVKLMGPIYPVEPIISASDIGLLFTKGEGISNAILEYMACGIPVITTDTSGGSKEFITNGVNGYICNRNVSEIKKLLVKIIDNYGLRKGIGKNARKLIENKFNINVIVKKYINLYLEE